MLRRQFLQLISDLRAELERSSDPAVGVSDFPTLKQKINRVYETLYDEYDWPHLTRTFDAIPLQAGQRYYGPSAGMDFDRMAEVVVWQSGQPVPIERGITFGDYASYNSELDHRSDPVVKWDVRFDDSGNKEVIEVWPIPASNSGTIQFRGIRKFTPLVDDADVCHLDDKVVVLYAAAELVPAKSGNKQLLLAAAKERLNRIKGRSKVGTSNIRMGLGGIQPRSTGVTVRVSG